MKPAWYADAQQPTPQQIQAWREALSSHSLVSPLSDSDQEAFLAALSLQQVSAGTSFIEQGAEPDGLYILLHGRARVWTRDPSGGQSWIGELSSGDVVGELSLLSGNLRGSMVTLVRDSVLAWLPQDDFELLAQRCPTLLRTLGRIAAERAQGNSHRLRARSMYAETIALLPVDDSIDVLSLGQEMAERLRSCGRVLMVPHRVVMMEDGTEGDLSSHLSEIERQHDIVIYIGDPELNSWTARCVRQADRVVMVLDATRPPEPRPIEEEILRSFPGDPPHHYQLLLVHPAGRSIQGTLGYLESRSATAHYHARGDHPEDLGRAGRLLTRRGSGVAFSGASSRGVAHVGILQALDQFKIPTDIVAGNSSGSGIAVMRAMGHSPESIIEAFLKLLVSQAPSPTKLAPPFVSLYSGLRMKRALRALFGDLQLEDLPIPAVITAADISRGSLAELRTGPAWLACRASSSLPAFWPPVTDQGRVLVDGGVLANLPIDAIESDCIKGMVFGADLNVGKNEDFVAFQDIEPYGSVLSGWSIFWDRVLPFRKTKSQPQLFEVLMHTMCIPSYRHQNALNRRRDDHLCMLRPNLPGFGFFDVTPEIAQELVAVAREDSILQLTEYLSGGRSETS